MDQGFKSYVSVKLFEEPGIFRIAGRMESLKALQGMYEQMDLWNRKSHSAKWDQSVVR